MSRVSSMRHSEFLNEYQNRYLPQERRERITFRHNLQTMTIGVDEISTVQAPVFNPNSNPNLTARYLQRVEIRGHIWETRYNADDQFVDPIGQPITVRINGRLSMVAITEVIMSNSTEILIRGTVMSSEIGEYPTIHEDEIRTVPTGGTTAIVSNFQSPRKIRKVKNPSLIDLWEG